MHISPFKNAEKIPQESVDAETAAVVIRDYLLPMFEGISSPLSRPVTSSCNRSVLGSKEAQKLQGVNSPRTMVDEMILSTCLSTSLRSAKSELEKANRESIQLTETNRGVIEKLILSNRAARKLEIELQVRNSGVVMSTPEYDMMKCRIAHLDAELTKKEDQLGSTAYLNSKLTEEMFSAEAKAEISNTEMIRNNHASALAKLENDVLAEQLKILQQQCLDGMSSDNLTLLEMCKNKSQLADTKVAHFIILLENMKAGIVDLGKQKSILEFQNALLTDRLEDVRVEFNKQLGDSQVERKKAKDEHLSLFEEREVLRKERDKLFTKNKAALDDKQKMKTKMNKFNTRRKLREKFADYEKTCRSCGKEYFEEENFNWSCRTHFSEFGGELWWCCGKPGAQSLGCRFSKHESKEENEEDNEDTDAEEEMDDTSNFDRLYQGARCFCCKSLGHISSQCHLDPNVRDSFDIEVELTRIDNLKSSHERTKKGALPYDIEYINKKCGYQVCFEYEEDWELDVMDMQKPEIELTEEEYEELMEKFIHATDDVDNS